MHKPKNRRASAAEFVPRKAGENVSRFNPNNSLNRVFVPDN